MQLQAFVSAVKNDQWFSFDEVMSVMLAHYTYQPTEFTNGLGADCLHNAAGSNEGSCKIFAFALINGLSKEQTLNLFGAYYRHDVLENPEREDHPNIRRFIRDGLAGLCFKGTALRLKV